eukprot:3630019-Pyramimonas_sp.AAC.1
MAMRMGEQRGLGAPALHVCFGPQLFGSSVTMHFREKMFLPDVRGSGARGSPRVFPRRDGIGGRRGDPRGPQ